MNAQLLKAKEKGYLRCSYKGDRSYNEWYRQCQSEGRPFIVVRDRKKYSDIKCDTFPARSEFSLEGAEKLKAQCWSYRALKEKLTRRSRWMYGPTGVYIYAVPIEDAEAIAEGILAIWDGEAPHGDDSN